MSSSPSRRPRPVPESEGRGSQLLRRCPFLLSGVLLLACAASPRSPRPLPFEGDAIYDPAGEWRAANRSGVRVRRPRGLPSTAARTRPEPDLRRFSPRELTRIRNVQPIVHAAAHAHSIPPDLINGVIWVESRFQIGALGRKGPTGLMQIMPRTGREIARVLGLRYHPYDPEFNIRAGTYYLARMLERFDGNLRLALAAYNIGPGTVSAWLRASRPLPGHSVTYIDNVFAAARALHGLDGVPAGSPRGSSNIALLER